MTYRYFVQQEDKYKLVHRTFTQFIIIFAPATVCLKIEYRIDVIEIKGNYELNLDAVDEITHKMNIDELNDWASASTSELNLLRQFLIDIPAMIENWKNLSCNSRPNLLNCCIGFLDTNVKLHAAFEKVRRDHIECYYKHYGKAGDIYKYGNHSFRAVEKYLYLCFDNASQKWFETNKKDTTREEEAQTAMGKLLEMDEGIKNCSQKKIILREAKKWFLTRYNLKQACLAACPGRQTEFSIRRFLLNWTPELAALLSIWAMGPEIASCFSGSSPGSVLIEQFFHSFTPLYPIGHKILPYLTIASFFLCMFILWLIGDNGRKMENLQLFMPRLFAGIVAGYLLLMSDEIWRYLFHDVINGQNNGHGIVKIVFPLIGVYVYMAVELSHVQGIFLPFKKAIKIFLRGTAYAVLIGTFVSDIFSDSMIRPVLEKSGELHPNNELGIQGLCGLIYPQILMFKAPLALFVGVVLQLLWDDKKLTDKI